MVFAIIFKLDESGAVVEFAMNDKCAAGTGRFLEAMARALEVSVHQMCDLDIGALGAALIAKERHEM